jgi:predicted molibdopterin-dependent oxidoreductase YjgC
MDDLRISSVPRGPVITILVNGKPCRAHEGETVHAALLASGRRVFGKTAGTGRPRGVFCGMGVCCECLVTIDGLPSQRACMTWVRKGMEVGIDE